jgi:hypothetical protein
MAHTPQTLQEQYLRAAEDGDYDEADRLAAIIDHEEAEREARLNAPGALKAAALWYAGQGIPVFPCRPGEKRPLTSHGFHDATTDPTQIEAWWETTPAANIGVPTGQMFDVIDVDGPAGVESLGLMRQDGLIPEVIGRATTPRGYHLYINPTGDGNTTALLPGVDYRGVGGYVIAAPSKTTDGGTYRWHQPLTLPRHKDHQ